MPNHPFVDGNKRTGATAAVVFLGMTGISIDAGDKGSSDPFSPRLFIYDNYPGGIGFSQPLYRLHRELLDGTRHLIAGCECENGCPGCVGPVGNTGPLAKAAAFRILDLLIAERFSGKTAAPAEAAADQPF